MSMTEPDQNAKQYKKKENICTSCPQNVARANYVLSNVTVMTRNPIVIPEERHICPKAWLKKHSLFVLCIHHIRTDKLSRAVMHSLWRVLTRFLLIYMALLNQSTNLRTHSILAASQS